MPRNTSNATYPYKVREPIVPHVRAHQPQRHFNSSTPSHQAQLATSRKNTSQTSLRRDSDAVQPVHPRQFHTLATTDCIDLQDLCITFHLHQITSSLSTQHPAPLAPRNALRVFFCLTLEQEPPYCTTLRVPIIRLFAVVDAVLLKHYHAPLVTHARSIPKKATTKRHIQRKLLAGTNQ